jgi:hypothetical protein
LFIGAALITTACAGADSTDLADVDSAELADVDSADFVNDEAEDLGTLEQSLTAGGGSLPFRGKIPIFPTEGSGQAGGLEVVYGVQVGLTNSKVSGLHTCWYRPSNPNNFYTAGDPFGCVTLGKDTATTWTSQTCPDAHAAAGFQVKVQNDGTINGKVDTFGLICRSLLSQSTFSFPMVGTSNQLFSQNEVCAGGYVEGFGMNADGTGVGGSCVLP